MPVEMQVSQHLGSQICMLHVCAAVQEILRVYEVSVAAFEAAKLPPNVSQLRSEVWPEFVGSVGSLLELVRKGHVYGAKAATGGS